MTLDEKVTNDSIKSVSGDMKDRSSGLAEHDVVCEKGRGDHERWAGNMLYRFLINNNKDSYNDLTPMKRSSIIGKIIDTIKEKGGWFVQYDEKMGKWAPLSEEKVRKKVSDDLRREIRRRREKRTSNSAFSAKLKALKEKEKQGGSFEGLLRPVDDPRESDVLFGPGARRHPGNKTYWGLMKANLNQYIISPYGARSMISRDIVQGIRDLNGRFLEQDPKTSVWYEITDKRAIDKTSHALSNKKYKSRKRHPFELSSQSSSNVSMETDSACDEDSACSSTRASSITTSSSLETMENIQGSARQGSKKHRLLQRMDDIPAMTSKNDQKIIHMNTDASSIEGKVVSGENAPPTTPYTKPLTKSLHGKAVVSPGDSKDGREDMYDLDEREAINAIHMMRMKKSVPPIITGHDMRDYMHDKRARVIEMEPRVTPRFSRYTDDEHYGYERVSYEPSSSSYYTSMPDRSPSYRHVVGRISDADYLYHLTSPSMHHRRILQPTSHLVNEWGNTPPRREEYQRWM